MPARFVMFGAWRTLDEIQNLLNREYKRDSDGQFSSGSGGGEGDDPTTAGDVPNPFDAPYAEHNVNEDGSQRFSAEYTAKYGRVTNEYGLDETHSVAVTEKGSIQFTDDSGGARNRVVVQEFTKSQAKSLSDDMNDVNDNGGSVTNRATGVRVTANGQVHPQGGYHGVDVTWSNGTTTSFDPVSAVELGESLGFAADDV